MRVTTRLRSMLGVSRMCVERVRRRGGTTLVVEVRPSWGKRRCTCCGKKAPEGCSSADRGEAPSCLNVMVLPVAKPDQLHTAARDGVLDHYATAEQGHAVALVGYRTADATRATTCA